MGKIAKKHAKKGKKVAHHKKVIKRIKKVHRRLVKRAAAYAITIHKTIIIKMRKLKVVNQRLRSSSRSTLPNYKRKPRESKRESLNTRPPPRNLSNTPSRSTSFTRRSRL